MTQKNNAHEPQKGLPEVCGFTDDYGHKWVSITYKGKTALLRYADFVSGRVQIWGLLAERGLIIIAKAAKTSIMEQVEALDLFTRRRIFSRPGWCNGQFANASGKVFAPPEAAKGLVAFTPMKAKCAKKGSLTRWRQQVARPLVGHPIPSFILMTCFAAPMLELVGRAENFGFELSGEGGKGKSTTQRLMASVVGPAMGKDKGYMTSFYATPAALEKLMEWHSDMPFIIDEANLFGSGSGGRADRNKMSDFSFQMASGSTKARMATPDQEGYRFIFVTSANEPFHELLGDVHRDTAQAATDRLMSIVISQGDAGVFGPQPEGYESYRQFTQALETAMAQQYGTAMPKFIQKLVLARHNDETKLQGGIRARIAEFKHHFGVNENNGSDVRVSEAFGLVYAAGHFAQHHGILPAEFDCLGAAAHCYANYRATVPVRQSLTERLLAVAARPETMQIDRSNLPTLSDEDMEKAGAFIRVVKDETLLLMTTALRNRLFPDWQSLANTGAFRVFNKTDKGGRGGGYHCRVRANAGNEWFFAFTMPRTGAAPTED